MNARIDYPEYLAAKRSIDDRALNRHVWTSLWNRLPARPLRIVEVGAGIGTMIERLLEAGVLRGGRYAAVDRDGDLLRQADRRLHAWAAEQSVPTHPLDNGLELDINGGLQVRWVHGDVTEDGLRPLSSDWDLVLAHALLDLVDLESTLPSLLRLIPPQGWFWFTINFDGVTRFLPTLNPDLDRRIEGLYHKTMDRRTTASGHPSGHSRTGRRLLSLLLQKGCRVAAAGASDWVIFPTAGAYSRDELTTLQFMLDTVENALAGHPGLDRDAFRAWLEQRRRQLAEGNLALLTHQLDICGQRGAAYPSVA